MNSQENRDRLAREVKVARLRKFKTVDRARIAAGVSRGTWDNVERGDAVKEFSLAAIEEALDWPAGRALAILRGDPEPTGERGPGRLAALIEDWLAGHPGATNAQVAERVGVATSTIGRWRAHALSEIPDPEALVRLANLLGVDSEVTYYAAGVDAGYIIEHETQGTPDLDLAAGLETGQIAARFKKK